MRRKFSRSKLIYGVFLLAVMSGFASPSFAVEVKNLFEASVNVRGQQKDERKSAMAEGFTQVLVRVSGSDNILADSAIRSAMSNAQHYVSGYSYRNLDVPAGGVDEASYRYALLLKFDEQAIYKLLRGAELPVWGKQRNSLMVWWVLDDGERLIINAETAPREQDILTEKALIRGVPLNFPILDLQDNYTIDERDLWGFFFDKIQAASQRYGSTDILVGRSSVQDGQTRSKWVLMIGDDYFWSENEVGYLEAVLPEAVNFAADRLAERYAVSSRAENASTLRVKVAGINTLKQFADTERYFRQQDIIKRVDVLRIEQDKVVFELALRTDAERFYRMMANNLKYSSEPATEQLDPPDDGVEMVHFRLQEY